MNSEPQIIQAFPRQIPPAVEALITIGLPSIQPTVDLLAIEENDLRRALAVRVIRYVEGPDVALFVLEKAMSSETDAKRKSMLADAYARMQKLVNQTR